MTYGISKNCWYSVEITIFQHSILTCCCKKLYITSDHAKRPQKPYIVSYEVDKRKTKMDV